MLHVVYPSGKPMIPYLLRCQGLAVVYCGFTLGRLESGAPSTFAQLGYKIPRNCSHFPKLKFDDTSELIGIVTHAKDE